jgi:hypothetical protein
MFRVSILIVIEFYCYMATTKLCAFILRVYILSELAIHVPYNLYWL